MFERFEISLTVDEDYMVKYNSIREIYIVRERFLWLFWIDLFKSESLKACQRFIEEYKENLND